MSSGQHLSKELYDLVKSIGETRSKQEEDKIISQDVIMLKSKIGEKNIQPKKMKEYLIRAIYIEMLGHDAGFAYIHSVNLTQNKALTLKRMGYLACSLFLNQDSELLILLVATLQRDLMSKTTAEVSVALHTVAKLVSPSIVHALIEPVNTLLVDTNENIRKKAVMVLQKFQKISAGTVADIHDKMKRALCDKDPSVMACSLNLFFDLVKQNPSKFKDLTSSFVVILKQVIEHKLPRDYDYHRIPAPWIQIKLLQILAMLGANDQKVSEHIYEVLNMTMKRADDTGINIGYAITYQCVKTISSIYPNQNLLETAASSVSRFLTSEHHNSNNNLKYLGINALISIVQINPKYALDHQLVVVDCLESRDETLKRETLDLLYKMTNQNNVGVIVEKLIHYLKGASDAHFKKDLVNKITQITERYAPSSEWYISAMNTILEYGSEFVDEGILTNMLKFMEEKLQEFGEEFGVFLINTYGESVLKGNIPDVMSKIVAWVFGEVGNKIYSTDPEKLTSLIQILCNIIEQHHEDEYTKGWILTAVSKLAVHPGVEGLDIVENIFSKYSKSKFLELQQRAIEYKSLRKYGSSSSVPFDRTMSFLDSYVQRALKEGAKQYGRPNKLPTPVWEAASHPEKNALRVEAYKPGERGVGSKAPTEEKAEKTEESLNVRNVTWDKEGIVQKSKEKDTLSMPQSITAKDLTSMSSSDYQKKQTTSSYGGIGSDKMGGGGSFDKNPVYPTNPYPIKKVDPAEDLEKKRKADLLFGGMLGSTGTTSFNKPTTGGIFGQPTAQNLFGQPIAQAKPTTFTSNTATTVAPKKPAETVNLLDMDFEPVKTTPPQQTTSNVNLLGDVFSGSSVKPQASAPIQNQGFSQNYKTYEPVNLDLETYENYWTGISAEVEETVQTMNVKGPAQFKKVLNLLKFGIVSEIDAEMICAAKNKANEFILLYVVCNPTGKLDIKVKSSKKENMLQVISDIKNASKAI
jgi:AP-4 complex subunit epsilon-1